MLVHATKTKSESPPYANVLRLMCSHRPAQRTRLDRVALLDFTIMEACLLVHLTELGMKLTQRVVRTN